MRLYSVTAQSAVSPEKLTTLYEIDYLLVLDDEFWPGDDDLRQSPSAD
ncbi:MAG: hypothetical protein J7545_05130 [Roseofilum sp. SBFL]|nr:MULTISPECIES: hypothetical protein [unclassified Roseofilum]MBP0013599.1 hypothetical protein [Roseofilum sp. SID3]MBP0025268.1 hypothetical protein [Roseofilum sp. SID2]MBP0041345.1 hypothetical protein [Roseofilum sp. SBFL]